MCMSRVSKTGLPKTPTLKMCSTDETRDTTTTTLPQSNVNDVVFSVHLPLSFFFKVLICFSYFLVVAFMYFW